MYLKRFNITNRIKGVAESVQIKYFGSENNITLNFALFLLNVILKQPNAFEF